MICVLPIYMEVKITNEKDGVIYKFTVQGSKVIKCYLAKDYLLELSLNGDYTRTPSGVYNMLYNPSSPESIAYQVILTIPSSSQTAKAEIELFKFNEIFNRQNVKISEDDYNHFITEEPRLIAQNIQSRALSDLPASVAKFLTQAKKCTSS